MNSSFNERDFQEYIRDVEDRSLVNDDATIQMVARHLETWEELARYLSLQEVTVTEIKHDYKMYKEQKFQCIKQWVKVSGKAATLYSLLRTIYFHLSDKSVVMNITESLHSKEQCDDGNKENMAPQLHDVQPSKPSQEGPKPQQMDYSGSPMKMVACLPWLNKPKQ